MIHFTRSSVAEVFRVSCNHSDLGKIFKTIIQPYKDAIQKQVKDKDTGSGEEVRCITQDKTCSQLEAANT